MKKLLLLIVITFCSLPANAQTGSIFTLHPSLGTKITLDEKKQFSIFPEYPDNTFESAQFVKYNDSTFTVLLRTTTDTLSQEKTVSITQLWAIYYQVEMIKPAPTDEKARLARSEKTAHVMELLGEVGDAALFTVTWSLKIFLYLASGKYN